jgi:hypothetical protein
MGPSASSVGFSDGWTQRKVGGKRVAPTCASEALESGRVAIAAGRCSAGSATRSMPWCTEDCGDVKLLFGEPFIGDILYGGVITAWPSCQAQRRRVVLSVGLSHWSTVLSTVQALLQQPIESHWLRRSLAVGLACSLQMDRFGWWLRRSLAVGLAGGLQMDRRSTPPFSPRRKLAARKPQRGRRVARPPGRQTDLTLNARARPRGRRSGLRRTDRHGQTLPQSREGPPARPMKWSAGVARSRACDAVHVARDVLWPHRQPLRRRQQHFKVPVHVRLPATPRTGPLCMADT